MNDLIDEKDLQVQIINAKDINQLKEVDNLFKLSRLKRELLRSEKWERLQDKIVDTASDRLEKTANYITNSDMLDFLKITQSSIDRSHKIIDEITEQESNIPSSYVQHNTVNVTYIDSANKESKDKIRKAALLMLNNMETVIAESIASDIEQTKERLEEEAIIKEKEEKLLNDKESLDGDN